MRKTTTTQTRSTTSTRTWWAKSALLVFLLLPLFLISCEENLLTIGFRKEPKSFQIFYRELPIESATLLGDSLLTYNSFNSESAKRLLVGRFSDPDFGDISAEFYSQIRPSNTSRAVESGAVFDSVTLKLRLDYYHYGSVETTTQPYHIYTVLEELINNKAYYNRSEVERSRSLVGQTSVTVNTLYLDQIVENQENDTLLLSTTLSPALGQQLFDLWAAKDSNDSTFIDFFKFKQAFKGISIVPAEGGDKVLGFNPASSLSELVLHYHVDTTKYDYDFYFDNVMGFSRLVSDRANTALFKLAQPKVEYQSSNGMNYVQSGVGIFSKLNFESIVKLRDTVPHIAFNSVELEIPVEAFEERVRPPAILALRLLNEDNSFAPANTTYYSQNVVPDGNSDGIYVRNDLSSAAVLSYDKEKQLYRGFITQFAQLLFNEENPDKRFTNFALYPLQPEAAKSVDRVVFDRSKLKLKVFYTKALSGNQPE